MKKIILWGNTPLSAVIAEYINETEGSEVVAFTVDKSYTKNQATFNGLPLIPFEEITIFFPPDSHKILVTVTSGSKARFLNEIKCKESIKKGYELFTFVHPEAYVAKSAKLGSNCIVCPKAIIEPCATINNGVFIRSAAYISHGTNIGEYTYIAPRAALSGSITTGRHCFFGTNCTVRDKVTIGNNSVIGAGAVVLKNLQDETIIKAAYSEILHIRRDKITI